MKFKVSSDIPPPTSMRGGKFARLNEILRGLSSGQSVWVSETLIERRIQLGNVVSNALGKGNYATRRERSGWRIWRI